MQPLEDLAKSLRGVFSVFTNPRLAAVTSLQREEKYDEANALYEKDATFFASLPPDDEKSLAPLADHLNAALAGELQESTTAINGYLARSPETVDRNEWPRLRDAIRASAAALQKYNSYSVLKRPLFRLTAVDTLANSTSELTDQWRAASGKAFTAYDHSSSPRFEQAYPVDPDVKRLVADALPTWVEHGDPASLARLLQSYADAMSDEQRHTLAKSYFLSARQQRTGSLAEDVRIYQDMLRASFPALTTQEMAVTVLALGGPQRSNAVAVDIRGASGPGVPTIAPAELPTLSSQSHFLILDASDTKIERKVTGKTEVPTRYITGQREVHNPAYDNALIKYQQTDNDYRQYQANASANPATKWAGVLQGLGGIALATARGNALRELTATPQVAYEDVYEEYSYTISTVSSRKQLTARVFAIDTGSGEITQFTLSREDQKTFQLAFNLRDKDASRASQYSSEADIDSFEHAPVVIDVGAIFKEFPTDTSPLRFKDTSELAKLVGPSAPVVAELPGRPASQAIADGSAQVVNAGRTDIQRQIATVQDAEQTDPRFESVVVITTPNGKLGSGFFVSPDVVLTNSHVVEGAGFAEVYLADGRKSFGRVMKTDINLDLALLRVADTGPPVEFFGGQVPVGATVDVIGHPKGLSYSLSRGVVSAVRKMKNPFVKGGALITYIQTDARINVGNSGGPMYLGNKVVGINTQKMTGAGVEGIGFAVHYLEVLRFILD